MRIFKRVLAILAGLIVVTIAGVFVYLVLVPPTLLRVGAGYSSKIICSSTFLSGRAPDEVLKTDVQAPGNPVLKAYIANTDRSAGVVHAAFLWAIAPMSSVLRPGLGCAAVPDGNLARARDQSAPPAPGASKSTAIWPKGEAVDTALRPDLSTIVTDPALAGPGMRAIVVVRNGRIVAENYGPGFTAATPLLGWSMTKSVTAALTGTVIKAGKLRLGQDNLLTQWANDQRAKITVAQLMSMSSGLQFNEDYGDVSDVTRMLYLEPDMAGFAASQPLAATPGSIFHYSSGTADILSRIWQNAVGDKSAALAWPRKALFGPVGMGSAILETDESGTFVGSSYLYASARDWARFGLLLLQDGSWNGRQILDKSYVDMMHTPSIADADYGRGMLWMNGPGSQTQGTDSAKYGLPKDAYWLEGHDGQTVTVIPSAGVVVVRMGLTPSDLGYRPQPLVAAVLKALGSP